MKSLFKTYCMQSSKKYSLSFLFPFTALFLLGVCLATTGYGQGFHLGIKGGANLNKIDGKAFKEEFSYGYNAGLFAEIGFSQKWGIQPELLWNQSATRTSTEFRELYNDGIGELKDVKLNYLSIPLLLSYTPAKLLSFQAGPQFGMLINTNEDLLTNGRNAFKSGEFSLLGGLQLNLGSARIGGRYVIGLTDLNDIDNRDEWRNQGFQIYAGFRIL